MPKQLLKLLADNRGKGFFKAESAGDQATVYLYDVITSDDFWGGVSAINFAKELAAITAPVINLRINSPGGDVFAARAMEAAIREHPSQIVAHIDGQAASAATYVALAADTVKMSEGGFFMIHKAWSIALGNANDMLDMAALLEKVDESLVKTYATHTGQDERTIRDWMEAETWFSADEALSNGFIDEITTAQLKAKTNWNLSAYSRAPEQRTEKQEEPDKSILINEMKIAHLHRMAALAKHL